MSLFNTAILLVELSSPLLPVPYMDAEQQVDIGVVESTKCRNTADCDEPRVCSDGKMCVCPEDHTDHAGQCFQTCDWTVQSPIPCLGKPGRFVCSRYSEYDAAPSFVKVDNSLEFTGSPAVPRLRFTCNYDKSKQYDALSVRWDVNDRLINPIFTDVKESEMSTTDLLETKLIEAGFGMGIRVHCEIRGRLPSGSYTEPTESEDFFAGLRVYTPIVNLASGAPEMAQIFPNLLTLSQSESKYVTLVRGQEGEIIVQPTVPIGCSGQYLQKEGGVACQLKLALVPTDNFDECTDSSISVLSTDYCGVHIQAVTQNPWNNGDQTSWRVNYTIAVTTKNDRSYGQRNTYKVQLQTDGTGAGHEIWKSHRIPDITVFVNDDHIWERKRCYSHVDPHMSTFDGRGYENQNIGDFIVYNHTKSPIQIQMRTKSCNGGHATCTCSVVIRAGGDVFAVMLCGKLKLIDYLSCSENILDVRKLGDTRYGIYTPIGTYVEITIHTSRGYKNTMNVDIFAAPKDFGSTEGLCGNVNGHLNDDFVMRNGASTHDNNAFSKSWSIDASESFIETFTNVLGLDQWNPSYSLCVCKYNMNSPLAVDGVLEEVTCSADEFKECKEDKTRFGSREKCVVRGTRSVHLRASSDFEFRRRLSMMNKDDDISNIEKRSVDNAMSYAEAMAVCSAEFSKIPTYEMKDQVPDVNMDAMLNDCALDVEIVGDAEWANAHADSWQLAVANEIERDVIFQRDNGEVASKFKESSCPYNCYDQGTCVNGTCSCNEGVAGTYCAIKRSDLLEIDDISGGGICDMAKGDNCKECVFVQGESFLGDGSLTCRVAVINITIDGRFIKDAVLTGRAVYGNYFEAHCCLSSLESSQKRRRRSTTTEDSASTLAWKYEVSISNDQQHFGTSRDVYVFNSQCQQNTILASGDVLISLKAGYCFIQGQCYTNGSFSFMDPCLQCLSETARSTWISVCPQTQAPNDVIRTVIIAVSTMVGVACILAAVGLFLYIKKSKAKIGVSPEMTSNTTDKKEAFALYNVPYMGHMPGNTRYEKYPMK